MLRLNHVTFAADDARRLCSFWAALLDYRSESGGADWFARGDGLELRFARMPKSPTIEVPIHLDVNAPDREATVRRALDLGARLVESKTIEIGTLKEQWSVLRDPEGNGFCIQGPDTRRGRVYIGNITFSTAEPRKLGPFWSEALGWPEQVTPDDFLEMLWDAGLDRAEYDAYYAIKGPDESSPRLFFQRREKSRPEHYPLHVDLLAKDREAEIERLTAAGATATETKTAGERVWTVMRDPDANPFCLE
ncbi:MAG: VOC family protein [Actinobacteria bacterium]|nr:MAG: VOC family protein [Actinomycetota bacterium]